MDQIIMLDGPDLDHLRNALAFKSVRSVRIAVDGDQIKFKINEFTWSPPVGYLDPQCDKAIRAAEAKKLVDTNEFCADCEHSLPGHYDTCIVALKQRFPFIVKWEEHMGSKEYWLKDQLLRAAKEFAPSNSIYYSTYPPSINGRHWQTTDDITNPELIKEWGLECDTCGWRWNSIQHHKECVTT